MKTITKAPLAGKNTPKTDILDHIVEIVEILKRNNLSDIENPDNRKTEENDEKNKKLNRHAGFIAKKLGITPFQAVMFSVFMEKNNDSNITMQEIACAMNLNSIKILKYTSDFDALEKKKLIRCSRTKNSITYRVPYEVCDSLRKNGVYKISKKENLKIEELFTKISELFEEKSDNELTYDALLEEMRDLIGFNRHLQFCKKVKNYELAHDDFLLLMLFCHLSANNDDDNVTIRDFNFIFDDSTQAKIINKNLSKGKHELIQRKIVEHNNDNGFFDSQSWRLSDNAKKELFSELGYGADNNNETTKNLLKFDKIKPKKMFYNSKEKEAVGGLIDLLQEKNYRKILARLDKKGLRKGFACLFSGLPGTGKTETAYQIARATKRNIMMVDIAAIKSCWYGESEKKIKQVFDDYREAAAKSKLAPILLFNEADAIIGKRKEFTAGSRAIDQVENTIQNIILQEMENLCGILIATTNLTKNMDQAFERRFLYKIEFSKPSPDGRLGIWKTMLPDLSNDKIEVLSYRFDLSGGQIENIARKIEVDSILKGDDITLETLIIYCNDEIQNGFNGGKKIGFA